MTESDGTTSVLGVSPRTGAGPLPAVADRQPACRQCPQRLVQLGFRPALRRHLRAPDRGHRRGRNLRGVVPRSAGLAALAGAGLGRGPGDGRPVRPVRPVRALRDLPPTSSPSCSRPGWPTGATAPARRSRPGRRPGRAGRRRATTASADLSDGADRRAEAVGAPSVVRMRVPDEEITFDDLVRGQVTFPAEHVPDYVIVRGNGEPLYTLVNPVDDSLMGITHVLRGEDLLPSTPRQIVLYRALSRSVSAAAGRRSSGTCPPSWARATGGCPSGTRDPGWPSTASRATCPRPCSTTWRCWAGRSPTTATSSPLTRWCEAFDIRRVNANPARFDPRSARRSTPPTSGGCRPAISPTGSCRSWSAPAGQRPADARRSAPCSTRPPRWSRSG